MAVLFEWKQMRWKKQQEHILFILWHFAAQGLSEPELFSEDFFSSSLLVFSVSYWTYEILKHPQHFQARNFDCLTLCCMRSHFLSFSLVACFLWKVLIFVLEDAVKLLARFLGRTSFPRCVHKLYLGYLG